MFKIRTAEERALLAIVLERIANDCTWFPLVLESPVSEVALARFVQNGLLKKNGPSDYEIQIDEVLAAAADEAATQPAGPAIAEAPQRSPERAAAANPGSAPSGSPVAAEGTQGASGAVRWSNYRKPAVWRELLEDAKARFTSPRGWSKERAEDPAAFDGSKTWVRMSQTKALELGLRLPEFETEAK